MYLDKLSYVCTKIRGARTTNGSNLRNFRLRRWGSLLPGQRILDPPLDPQLTLVSRVTPSTPKKSYLKFRNPRTTFGYTPLVHPKVLGSPDYFLIKIILFLLLRSPCTISEPYDNPFWVFSNGGKSKSKKD
jgi:hypothetical protein